MRTRLACAAAFLLLASLVLQASTAEDIYWEGEDAEEREFLEVKDESVLSHLTRLKRGVLDWLNPFTVAPTTTTPAPENYESITEDQEDTVDNNEYDTHDNADGSGAAPDPRIDHDPGEKTLRVSFVVMEPFLDNYSNRDSELFQTFSHNLANSVNALFDDLPGTQKASLVRIQSRVSDNFSCKVTLDIVTTADNTDQIAELLRVHIRNTRQLGIYTLTDADFSADVVNPGPPFEKCQVGELQCYDGRCVPGSSFCNGIRDCSDGADENDCPVYDPERRDDSINQVVVPRPRCDNPIPCDSSAVTICPEQRCDGHLDCPGGDDEDRRICEPDFERGDQSLQTTHAPSVDETTRLMYTQPPEECPAGEFRCDETRCIPLNKVCDREPDCSDGTDEAKCKAESCGRDDFVCSNNKCIESSKRCDKVFDCPDREDEFECECSPSDFRCIDDGTCIEISKRCDGTSNCLDGSDEMGCACKPDQWQCDQGNCIKRSKRCNGRVDCPSDRSDERNCVAHGYFKCQTGKVIPDSMRCNRRYDCPPEDYSDEQNCPCGDDDFRCNNGHCIQAYKRCDRTHDCQDGSDELHCKYGTECMAYEYKCTNGQCVHAESFCNGTVECADGSDEGNCPCKRGQFRCRDASCINIVLRCNGQTDCSHGEDELNCGSCSADLFTCPSNSRVRCASRCDDNRECDNGEDEEECSLDEECHECDGQCLTYDRVCDGKRDCSDGSDEANCEHCDRPDDFRCDDGDCIKLSQRCNNIAECNDDSDERNCNETMPATREGCSDGQFRCRDGTCLNNEFLCDGHRDCYDGSDEISCTWFMTRASRSPSPAPCVHTQFTCGDGRCIPLSRRCDNIYDCSDFSDEQKCHSACRPYEFRCDNRCFPQSIKCDRNPDCIDGADEAPELCDDITTRYSYPEPSTPSPVETTVRETYVSGSGGSRRFYSPFAPRTERPQTNDASSESDRNDIDNSVTTQAPNGRYDPYSTENPSDPYDPNRPYGSNQPGSNNPSGSNQPGSYDPYGSNQPGSNNPSGSNQPGSYDPYGSNQPGSNNPSGSNQPGSYDPYGSNQPGSNNPSGSNQPGSYDPYGSNQPGSNNPSGSNQPGSYDPYGSNQPGSNNPSGSNQPGSNNPSGSNQPGSYDPYGSNQPGSNNPSGSNQPGSNNPSGSNQPGSYDPYGSNQPGSNNPSGSNQPGSINPSGSNQPGSYDPYGSNQPGSNNPSGSNQPGSNNPSGSNQPGSYDPYGSNQPESNNPSGSNQPGSNNPSGSNQPGSYDPYGSNQPGSNNPSGSNQPGSNNPSGSNQPGSYDPYSSNQGSSNDIYGSNQPGSNNPSGSNQPDSYDPYGSNQPGSNNPSGSNQPGSYDPYGSNQGSSNDIYGSNQDGSNNPYGSNQPGSDNGSNQGSSNDINEPDQSGSNDPYGSNQAGSNVPYDSNQETTNQPDTNDIYGSIRPGSNPNPDSNNQYGGGRYPGQGQSGYPGYPAGASVACKSFEWRCENGPCIDARRRCDGHIDCPFDFSDEFDCPAGSPVTLNVKTYPTNQTVRYGGDVVFQCRDEGPRRARVNWVREGGRSLKTGSSNKNGRLELYQVTLSDAGVYICQTPDFLDQPGSAVRVSLTVKRPSRPVTTRPPFTPCGYNEATCSNGECIPKSAVCDGKMDCSDRSDEDNCNYNGRCEPNQFQCENRKCVLKSWLCDSDDDCGDGSDEKNCPSLDPNAPCLPIEFSCYSNSQCVPRSFQCDKNNDCIDGSDEVGCGKPIYITKTPSPANVRLNPGDTLFLTCEAVGVPEPIVSWRLNWGHVPPKCTETFRAGVGNLTCVNMMPEDSGAYSCEAINNQGTVFAIPDAIVFVSQTNPCPEGYFNNEARSQSECIRCFCFGNSVSCHSADLFTYNMPTPLGEGGTRLLGVALSGDGAVRTDSSILNHYYYLSMRNGATVTKLKSQDDNLLGIFHPFLTLPESYNGNQLTSYGGHIKYTIKAQTNNAQNDDIPSIIVKGKYATLYHIPSNYIQSSEFVVEARFVPEYWQKAGPNGYLIPATREDIMMALDAVDMILLRADNNNAGVNITDFLMESAQHMNSGLGAASLVEECTCPEGYDGLSCQKCKPGYVREESGPFLGRCVRKSCPPGTYGDPAMGNACKPCPCPLTNKANQFATTCSLSSSGAVVCDCFTGYEGQRCEKCAAGFVGNPLVDGDSCRVQPTHNCNDIGTRHEQVLDCVCKDNVQGRYCDQCRNGSFYLSNDFRHGCALCFCSGESQQCMSSNLRRKTTSINFKVPAIVDQVKVYNTQPQGNGNFRYTAPVETNLRPLLTRGGLGLSGLDRSRPTVYYWSMPLSFAGNKVTSYGGYLRYTLDNVPSYVDTQLRNKAADVQLISDNALSFQYFGNLQPSYEGVLNVSVQLLEKGWQRSDGKEVPREHFLLALADVKTILIKATYATDHIATPLYASIETAASDGDGPAALHVEQCVCPAGYVGTSCEDCAPGFTRGIGGLYLAHCEECQCNGHSNNCHPETGQCYECLDNTDGPRCELCKEGYERDGYDQCVAIDGMTTLTPCRCDPRGEAEPCDADGTCTCKRNVDGGNCDRCRPGTYGLRADNPDGCLPCFCSGATTDCQEAMNYYRAMLPAPIFGDNYGGYTIMNINADIVINDQFIPNPDKSELMYIFSNNADRDLYWSLPIFPGNRVLSYGGYLALRQEFSSNDGNVESEQGNDVILIGDDVSLAWYNPNVLRSGESMFYQVPLREQGWTHLNSAVLADRSDFMTVLKSLRRVLVKATLAERTLMTSIADVSMDIATEQYTLNAQTATGIEICTCPPGHLGTSCETCAAGFYKNEQDYCTVCPCNGHDCQMDTNQQVVCNCRPPYTGRNCSTYGLLMELHPTLRDGDDPVYKLVTLTCKYRAPEPLTIKFVVEDQDYGPVKPANESTFHPDGWHGEHAMEILWDTRQDGKIFECHTITHRNLTLGVLFTDMRRSSLQGRGQPLVTNRPPMPQSTVTVRITSPSITIQEVGSSVNFTCQAQSPLTQRLVMSWSKVDGYLPQGRSYIDQYSGILRITNLQITDSGQYICQTSDGRSTGQASVTLKVPANQMVLPSVEIRPPIKEYYAGDRIELECIASGSPRPTISWQRASRRPLPMSSEHFEELFIIESAREEDSGEYRCIAANTVGSADSIAVINVRPRPAQPPRDKLVVQPTSATLNEGQSTRLVCTGSTNVPAGTIDWVRQDGGRFQANVRSDNGVLYIDVATMINAGVYVCQTHGADVSPESVLLTVVSTATPSPNDAPEVMVPLKTLTIPSGGSGKVDCFPRGRPLPLIRWTKYQDELGRGVSQRGDSLIINEAEESDAGYYVCEGLDRRDSRALTSVFVYIDIEKRERPVVQIWPEGEQPVALGNTEFEFHCRVLSGIPKPEVTWSRAGGRALSSHAEIKPNNILKFDKIEVNDEGEYICTGDNTVGSSSASAVIKVRSPPEIVITPAKYLTVKTGQPVNIECRAEGYPEPIVTIRGPDQNEIISESRIARLRIPSVEERDEGDYTCMATNQAGTMEEAFALRLAVERGDGGFDDAGSGDDEIYPNQPDPVYPNPNPNENQVYNPNPYPEEPQNPIRPSERTAFEGQRELTIYCNVTNGYNPTWDRGDRQPLQYNAQQVENRLIIRNVSKSDSGRYVCSAYNYATNAIQVALYTTLRVVSVPKITLRPPTQTVHPGYSPTVECVVEGDDIVDIQWRPTSRPFSSRVNARGATLIFQQIEVEDAGKYECIARNQWANASATAEVIVVEESNVASSESHEHEQWVHAGAGVVLSCNVTGTVSVQWTKDGRAVPPSIRTNRDGSLFIKIAHATHSGQYICHIRDNYGRQTSNYINLHIEGIECLSTEFRCVNDGSCIDEELICDGFADCNDRSDEDCMLNDERFLQITGAPEEPLVRIEQPRRAFRVGENVDVLCKSTSQDVAVEWIKRDQQGNRQHVDSHTYGGGSLLRIIGVAEQDAGTYQCIGRNRFGLNYTDNFNLDIVPGSIISSPRDRNGELKEYSAALRSAVSMPCTHDLEEPVTIQWRREYVALPSDARSNQPILHLRSVTEGDAGTYVCRVSNSRTTIETKAILRVVGVIPRFDGASWVALPTLRDAYRQFDIEVSFKPTDANGLILYNSQNAGRDTDFLALILKNGVPEFILETGSGPVLVSGDRPLALNRWHSIRLNKIDTKVTMDVDNDGPFVMDTAENWVLELDQPLYIGGVPDYLQLPSLIQGTTGFAGCVSMLVLGQSEKNIMMEALEQERVATCDTCAGNLCQNGSVCQESRNERGYSCICNKEFAGPNCDRRGEACRPGICGVGKCSNTDDGYKCACPVTHTGRNCETRQQIEYPAFTGSAYLALKPPTTFRYLKMSMKVKASAPVTDGIIMYSAESPRGHGGFTSLAVKNGRLEFRYDLGDGNPAVLTSNSNLSANDWTDVQVARSGHTVSLNINLIQNYEARLESAKSLKLETPLFVGGVDENIVLNSNTGVSGGFMGCIKDLKTFGTSVNIDDPNIESSNVRECSSFADRGDIPEIDNNPCRCNNGGSCASDGSCICPPGFSGYYCDSRLASSLRYPSRAPADPCDARPCQNGGTCHPNYLNRMNHTCDCRLGFAGASCQMSLELYSSVGFNGNGYLELPSALVDYKDLDRQPAVIALRASTVQDGVLAYQREMAASLESGDYLLIRIENGHVVLEWDMGSGITSVSVTSDDGKSGFVTDGEMHQIVVRLLSNGRVELSVDGITKTAITNGLANSLNVDSNIYIGGIPERLNMNGYSGLIGCIDQVEFMDTGRGVTLGSTAVTGRNTQMCKNR